MPKFLYWPVKPLSINQPFGGNPGMYAQFGLKGHNGVDLRAYHGQPVYASFDGVAFFETDENQGEGVVIVSNEAWPYDPIKCEFTLDIKFPLTHAKCINWHLCDERKDPKYTSPVLLYQRQNGGKGMPVRAGDLIGFADNTGFSTGDHLHWGLKAVRPGSGVEPSDATDEGIGNWMNVSPNNGYLGAINPLPYANDFFSQDSSYVIAKYTVLVDALTKLWNLLKFK